MRLGNSLMPIIKWTGSKRSQAKEIVSKFPQDLGCYYEPFIGGGSIISYLRPKIAVCSDICKPLIDLWKVVQDSPDSLLTYYQKEWNRLKADGHLVFYDVRNRFNETHSPYDLFFLSRTCVNGLIRFNKNGEFNNSLHHTRRGIQPERLAGILVEWQEVVKPVDFCVGDYRKTLARVETGDFVYLDPPYFYTKGRYYGTINFSEFLDELNRLNKKKIKYALSFDGKSTEKDYSVEIPKSLYKRHFLLRSGYSSFRKVIDKTKNMVEESLYLNY